MWRSSAFLTYWKSPNRAPLDLVLKLLLAAKSLQEFGLPFSLAWNFTLLLYCRFLHRETILAFPFLEAKEINL
jgi:hypothetical protein